MIRLSRLPAGHDNENYPYRSATIGATFELLIGHAHPILAELAGDLVVSDLGADHSPPPAGTSRFSSSAQFSTMCTSFNRASNGLSNRNRPSGATP